MYPIFKRYNFKITNQNSNKLTKLQNQKIN